MKRFDISRKAVLVLLSLIVVQGGPALLAQQPLVATPAVSPPPPPSRPIPWARRPLRSDELERLQKLWAGSSSADMVLEGAVMLGARGLLSRDDWLEFRRRGIDEDSIIRIFDSLGITPQEYDALKAIGVELRGGGYGPGRSAAPADVVIVGKVNSLQFHAEGPYHTWVDVRVERVLKGKIREQEFHQPERIWVKQLYSGPRVGADGEVVFGVPDFKPQFKVGERVLLFLIRHPGSLLYHYYVRSRQVAAQAQAYGRPELAEGYRREYGTRAKMEEEMARQDYFEEIGSYRVRGGKAVIKFKALRNIDPAGESFRLSQAEKIIRRVAEIQARFR